MLIRRLALPWLLASLTGCALLSAPQKAEIVYQLAAPATTSGTGGPLPALNVEIAAPLWLDNQDFHYRQDYVDPLRIAHYADSIWAERPASMLQQRLDFVAALHATTVASSMPLRVKLNLLDFSQHFTGTSQSEARLLVTAECMRPDSREPIARTVFDLHQPSPTADAAGGAKALSIASDTLIAQLYDWARQCLPPAPSKLLAQLPSPH